MGWTVFACFGCAKKRKRPKIKRVKRIRGYKALQSDDHEEHNVSESLGIPRDKPTAEAKARIRKKVRFNLDVVTYEPLDSYDDEHENNWEERDDKETEQTTATAVCIISTESNYRYNNCYVSEDEYDGDVDEYQISDDEDEDEDEDDNIHDRDDGYIVDLQNIYNEEKTEELHDCSSRPLISSETNARLRSHYIVPVLNPIQNLSQWKAIKSKEMLILECEKKCVC